MIVEKHYEVWQHGQYVKSYGSATLALRYINRHGGLGEVRRTLVIKQPDNGAEFGSIVYPSLFADEVIEC